MNGAVVRAGLNSNHLLNGIIGSPMTVTDSHLGANLYFVPDPLVTTRYVSIDNPKTYAVVPLGEVTVDAVQDTNGTTRSTGENKYRIIH